MTNAFNRMWRWTFESMHFWLLYIVLEEIGIVVIPNVITPEEYGSVAAKSY